MVTAGDPATAVSQQLLLFMRRCGERGNGRAGELVQESQRKKTSVDGKYLHVRKLVPLLANSTCLIGPVGDALLLLRLLRTTHNTRKRV